MAIAFSIKVAFILLALGALIFLIGFCSANWVDYKYTYRPLSGKYRNKQFEREVNFGLWRACIHDKLTFEGKRMGEYCFQILSESSKHPFTGRRYFDLSGEHRATQFFETVALLLLIPTVLFLVLGVFVEACRDRKILPILAGVCIIVAAGCVFLGAIIFGSWDGAKDKLHWSFALAVVGGVFFAFTGAAIIGGVILKK